MIASTAGVGVFAAPIATGASAIKSCPINRAAFLSDKSMMITISVSPVVASVFCIQPVVSFGVTGRTTSIKSSVIRPVVSRALKPSKGPGFVINVVVSASGSGREKTWTSSICGLTMAWPVFVDCILLNVSSIVSSGRSA